MWTTPGNPPYILFRSNPSRQFSKLESERRKNFGLSFFAGRNTTSGSQRNNLFSLVMIVTWEMRIYWSTDKINSICYGISRMRIFQSWIVTLCSEFLYDAWDCGRRRVRGYSLGVNETLTSFDIMCSTLEWKFLAGNIPYDSPNVLESYFWIYDDNQSKSQTYLFFSGSVSPFGTIPISSLFPNLFAEII